MWNHSVLLLMLCNFCRHFVFLLVCRHLQSVTLGNWEVSPEVTGKLPSLSSSMRSSQRLCAPVFNADWKMGSIHDFPLPFVCSLLHHMGWQMWSCKALSAHFHPVLRHWCCSQGVQAVTQRHLFGTWLFYLIPLVLSGGGRMEGTAFRGELLTMKPKLQPWLEHMVSPVLLEPVGLFWMEPLVKAGFVAACGVARLCLSPSFWQGPASRRASGQQIEQLVNSEQTAALQESPSMSSQPGSSTPANTQGEIWPDVPPLSAPFWCICVPWLASWFGFDERAIKRQIAWSEGYKFNHDYSHFSSVKNVFYVFHSSACIN